MKLREEGVSFGERYAGLLGAKPTSLRLRLFAFLGLAFCVLAAAVALILALAGVFDVKAQEGELWLDTELNHLSEKAASGMGKLTLQGIYFAETLAADIDAFLDENGARDEALRDVPSLIEPLLDAQADTLLDILRSAECSGAFLVLDATVNPTLETAADSRAGLFFKRTEPSASSLVRARFHCLRGPADVAREHGVTLLGQWQMEFNTQAAAFYEDTMVLAREHSDLPLSRLCHWSERVTLQGNSESGLLLCLPVFGEDGEVYGVCGIEVSAMLFKRSYSPDNRRYPGVFATLAPFRRAEARVLDTDAGLIAGNSFLANLEAGAFHETKNEAGALDSFRDPGGKAYVGRSREVKLYPGGAPAGEGDPWVLAILAPKEDWDAVAWEDRPLLLGAMFGLLLLGLGLALWISRHFIRPVVSALEAAKAEGVAVPRKTNIAEIDDLIEYLAAQDEAREALAVAAEAAHRETPASAPPQDAPAAPEEAEPAAAEPAAPDLRAYRNFVESIGSLSNAERAVFDLYMKGLTAREIAETLCLSLNTIKTHNKRIYLKLNVSSRKELLVYAQMMATEQPS